MMHINEISWAQLILVEIGAMFQVAAFCAFLRDTAKPSRSLPGERRSELPHEQESRRNLPVTHTPAQVVHYQRELHGVMEETPADVRPGNLVKTAKVNFKQTLKPYREEKPFVPSVRW